MAIHMIQIGIYFLLTFAGSGLAMTCYNPGYYTIECPDTEQSYCCTTYEEGIYKGYCCDYEEYFSVRSMPFTTTSISDSGSSDNVKFFAVKLAIVLVVLAVAGCMICGCMGIRRLRARRINAILATDLFPHQPEAPKCTLAHPPPRYEEVDTSLHTAGTSQTPPTPSPPPSYAPPQQSLIDIPPPTYTTRLSQPQSTGLPSPPPSYDVVTEEQLLFSSDQEQQSCYTLQIPITPDEDSTSLSLSPASSRATSVSFLSSVGDGPESLA